MSAPEEVEVYHGFSIMLNCQACREHTYWELYQVADDYSWICERCRVLERRESKKSPGRGS